MKENREKLLLGSNKYDHLAFMSWLRSEHRKVWSNHPAKQKAIELNRIKAPLGRITKSNPEGMVWCGKCVICGVIKRRSEKRFWKVDHIIPGGSFNNHEKFIEWHYKIIYGITVEGLQILCKDCHDIKTYSEKLDISFEEAKWEKENIIPFKNMNAKQQKRTLKEISKDVDFDKFKNKEQRIEVYRKLLIDKLKGVYN